jgi:DNA-directed RNA polymerase subunit RPC12/RpoP
VTYRCDLCWTEFESPVALLLHEAQEDDHLYEVDGLTDA